MPQKQEILKQVSGELALREKGIIVADTAQQAQAQIIQVLRKLGHDENPPVEIRSQELGEVRALGKSDVYGEVLVSVQMECGIDQLVNIMVGLAARPELIASNDLRLTSANPKTKTIGVHLTVSGVVPRKLVPGKKGAGHREPQNNPSECRAVGAGGMAVLDAAHEVAANRISTSIRCSRRRRAKEAAVSASAESVVEAVGADRV